MARRPEIVRLLVQNGSDIDASHGMEGSALQFAISRGDQTMVELLISIGASVDTPNVIGETALHTAVLGNEELVRILLQAGANPNAINSAGFTPYDTAVQRNDPAILRMLQNAR
jgi:ankyrin repeat protein